MNRQRPLARPRAQDGRRSRSGDIGSIERAPQQVLQDLSIFRSMGAQPSISFTKTAVRAKHLPRASVRFDDHSAAVETDQTDKRLINQRGDQPAKLVGRESGMTARCPCSTNRH